MYELRLAARSSHAAEAHATGTKELIVVLAGLLRMHVGNDRYELGPGDSLAFPADRPHTYENPAAARPATTTWWSTSADGALILSVRRSR